MRYAVIQGGTIQRFIQQDTQPPNIAHKGLTFLPVVTIAPATFDSATEKMSTPVYAIEAARVTETFTKSNLSAGELDTVKDGQISSIDKVIGAVLFDVVNEIRTLKTQPTLTKAQFVAYVKGKIGTF